jgi:hypothetical protein
MGGTGRVMAVVDYGIILGLAGIAVGGLSLAYARTQAASSSAQAEAALRQAEEARRQTEGATRLAVLESNSGMVQRWANVRRDIFGNPTILADLKEAHPRISEGFEGAGGVDAYIILGRVMDTFQDVYFNREAGVVTDHYWHFWTHSWFAFCAKIPTFKRTFEFRAKEGYMHPAFVEFYEPIFEGKALGDPGQQAP